MPANAIDINLLSRNDFANSPGGRILSWAVTYGRYIMIGTEVVVLLAFISRFSLDRKLTDLKESISQEQAILETNANLEQNIRSLQNRLEMTGKIINTQMQPLNILSIVQHATPPDVQFISYAYAQNVVSIHATAGTTEGFSQFIVNLNSIKEFASVDMQDVTKSPLTGIEFELTARVKPVAK